jgi:lipopolysaccharide transport system permease protein
MNLAVYGVVFGIYLRVEPPVGDPSGLENYAFFLVTGLLGWTFLTNAVSGSVGCLVANENLITKVYFPRVVLPTAVTVSHLVGLLIELGVLAIALVLIGHSMVLPWIPVLVPLLVLQFVFVLGLGLFLSVANAYFRDVSHFVGIFLNAWFYATPILYPESLVPDWARTFTLLNPMTHFVDAYRDLLYDLRFPQPKEWLLLTMLAAVSITIGWAFFHHHEPRLAEEL